MSRFLVLVASLLLVAHSAIAQGQLAIGDPAPKLEISSWVRGDPIPEFVAGHVYVVEFWATWCPPCKKSIPHLTELQTTYKDQATIVGVSAKDANGETLDRVRKHVASAGDTLAYTVAFDDGSKTNQAYMVAARQRGIPTAFVIDKHGKIAWIGHPLMGLDGVIERVVNDEFNPDDAQKGEALAAEIRELIRTQRHDEAMAKLDGLVAIDPKRYGPYAAYKFGYLLTTRGDRPAAYAYARQAMNGPANINANALSSIAWTILTDKETASRQLDLAMELSKRAVELSKNQDASILDTLARAHFESGDAANAIQTQKLAISVAKPAERKEMEATLSRYERKQ